jgi:hypothetical protein
MLAIEIMTIKVLPGADWKVNGPVFYKDKQLAQPVYTILYEYLPCYNFFE